LVVVFEDRCVASLFGLIGGGSQSSIIVDCPE